MIAVIAGVFGLLVGSFLNVVIHRVPQGESLLWPGSRCGECRVPIRPWHNIPLVGWILLRGRCAHCRCRIPVRYPLVELATAVLFAAVTARFGLSATLPLYLYLAAVAVPLTVIDLRLHRLPDAIVLPSYAVCAVLLVPAVATGGWTDVVRAVAAMAAVWAGYYALAWLYPGGMGFGDVKLAGLLGLCLGPLGWPAVLIGVLAGFLLGGLAGSALLLSGRAGRKTALPFGPFMLAGAFLAVFAAVPIASWYSSLLTPPV